MHVVFKRMACVAALAVTAALTPLGHSQIAASGAHPEKLDAALKGRGRQVSGRSRVIIRTTPGGSLSSAVSVIQRIGGTTLGRRLADGVSQVAVVPNAALSLLTSNPLIEQISLDRQIVAAADWTAHAVGAASVRQDLGYDGSGVGVAIIDSGITAWHDDLADSSGGQRVVRFVDFAGGSPTPRDPYGHGTHVAGIIAGNGFDSDAARSGMAPGANLIALKVLDATGRGHVSDVIAAIDYAVAERDALNIRVINLSIASGVYESYNSDPLTLAAQRAVRAGIVVVAAAGNNGRSAGGRTQYGGITSPGNAPWVLTVGASSHMGTADRGDDTIAAFTSRGPTALDQAAKPDIVAPGVGVESLSNPDSSLYSSNANYLLGGTRPTSYLPYLSLSGTSMSAPVVSGIVALMFQANPALTPNQVKAILQYSAEVYPDHDPLTEGAGFVNARGATELARYLATPMSAYPDTSRWGRLLIWGNHQVTGGRLTADANAWGTAVTWGATTVGKSVVSWGARCASSDCQTTGGKWRLEPHNSRNVVWGSVCAGGDCAMPWTLDVLTTGDGETVVWGTGTDDGETVVWGTVDGETVVWGTLCSDSSCTPELWGRR